MEMQKIVPMKIRSISWLTFLFLFSCQVKEKPDEWITGLMCRQLLEDINVVITNIDLNYKRDGFQESYLDEINESKKIAAWKNAYLKEHSKASLLKYADSIIY